MLIQNADLMEFLHSRLRPFLIKLQAPETKNTQGDQYASRIPKMCCKKSWQIRDGGTMLVITFKFQSEFNEIRRIYDG